MLTLAEYQDWLDYFTDRAKGEQIARARARGEIRTDDPAAVQALIKASGAAPKPRTMKGPAHHG